MKDAFGDVLSGKMLLIPDGVGNLMSLSGNKAEFPDGDGKVR